MFDGGVNNEYVSINGTGADTVGFKCWVSSDDGLPSGFDSTAITIQIGPLTGSIGSHVCIDSSYCPPSGEWKWSSAGEDYYPSWDGPHCLRMVACCIGLTGNVDNDPQLEIILNNGRVLDALTADPEWETSPFGTSIDLIDIDGDGIDEIIGYGQPGQDTIRIFDVDERQEKPFQ